MKKKLSENLKYHTFHLAQTNKKKTTKTKYSHNIVFIDSTDKHRIILTYTHTQIIRHIGSVFIPFQVICWKK